LLCIFLQLNELGGDVLASVQQPQPGRLLSLVVLESGPEISLLCTRDDLTWKKPVAADRKSAGDESIRKRGDSDALLTPDDCRRRPRSSQAPAGSKPQLDGKSAGEKSIRKRGDSDELRTPDDRSRSRRRPRSSVAPGSEQQLDVKLPRSAPKPRVAAPPAPAGDGGRGLCRSGGRGGDAKKANLGSAALRPSSPPPQQSPQQQQPPAPLPQQPPPPPLPQLLHQQPLPPPQAPQQPMPQAQALQMPPPYFQPGVTGLPVCYPHASLHYGYNPQAQLGAHLSQLAQVAQPPAWAPHVAALTGVLNAAGQNPHAQSVGLSAALSLMGALEYQPPPGPLPGPPPLPPYGLQGPLMAYQVPPAPAPPPFGPQGPLFAAPPQGLPACAFFASPEYAAFLARHHGPRQ
jgi:hypothetical protein